MIDHGPSPNRRAVMGAVAFAAASTRASAAPRPLDLTDPKASLDAYIKLRGSVAEQTVYFSYDGDIVLVRAHEDSVLLCGFRGIAKSIWRPDGEGGYRNTDYDIGRVRRS